MLPLKKSLACSCKMKDKTFRLDCFWLTGEKNLTIFFFFFLHCLGKFRSQCTKLVHRSKIFHSEKLRTPENNFCQYLHHEFSVTISVTMIQKVWILQSSPKVL